MTTRRDLMLSLPAIPLFSDVFIASAQTASTIASSEVAHSGVFSIQKLPITPNANGSSQHLCAGKLGTGEKVELHNTTLNPGAMPHPPHRHPHSEFLVIREGNVSWILEKETIAAGPGDILYAASNELHGIKNAGTTAARYNVIAVG